MKCIRIYKSLYQGKESWHQRLVIHTFKHSGRVGVIHVHNEIRPSRRGRFVCDGIASPLGTWGVEIGIRLRYDMGM